MAKVTATTGDADFSEVASMGLTPEAQAAMDKALGKSDEAPAPAASNGSENTTVATPSVATTSAPATGKSEQINGLKVTTF